MFSVTRRFVAGAICPSCGAQDRLVVYSRNELDHRECVACGFGEASGDERETPSAVIWVPSPGREPEGEAG